MKAKFSRRKYIYFTFDLEADRELAFAYLFLYGAVEKSKPLGEVGDKLCEMLYALRQEVIRHNEEIAESMNYALCITCAQEIDLRLRPPNHVPVLDGSGNLVHVNCPPLKSREKRNL